jgi:hypothetical protein
MPETPSNTPEENNAFEQSRELLEELDANDDDVIDETEFDKFDESIVTETKDLDIAVNLEEIKERLSSLRTEVQGDNPEIENPQELKEEMQRMNEFITELEAEYKSQLEGGGNTLTNIIGSTGLAATAYNAVKPLADKFDMAEAEFKEFLIEIIKMIRGDDKEGFFYKFSENMIDFLQKDEVIAEAGEALEEAGINLEPLKDEKADLFFQAYKTWTKGDEKKTVQNFVDEKVKILKVRGNPEAMTEGTIVTLEMLLGTDVYAKAQENLEKKVNSLEQAYEDGATEIADKNKLTVLMNIASGGSDAEDFAELKAEGDLEQHISLLQPNQEQGSISAEQALKHLSPEKQAEALQSIREIFATILVKKSLPHKLGVKPEQFEFDQANDEYQLKSLGIEGDFVLRNTAEGYRLMKKVERDATELVGTFSEESELIDKIKDLNTVTQEQLLENDPGKIAEFLSIKEKENNITTENGEVRIYKSESHEGAYAKLKVVANGEKFAITIGAGDGAVTTDMPRRQVAQYLEKNLFSEAAAESDEQASDSDDRG